MSTHNNEKSQDHVNHQRHLKKNKKIVQDDKSQQENWDLFFFGKQELRSYIKRKDIKRKTRDTQ